ncbi:MAG: Imm21 family immunity protein [Polyangiales bacterium]
MAKKNRSLKYVETEGGPFILLPMELKKSWNGTGDEDEGIANDYERAEQLVTKIGVLEVGSGKALVLGDAEVTAYWALDDGGVFIQRIMGDDDDAVAKVVEQALLQAKDWKKLPFTFDPGKGKLALFDSAYSYEDSDEDERLKVSLSPGTYEVDKRVAKGKDIELQLVRFRAKR